MISENDLKGELKSTKSVFFFTYTVSRPSGFNFYNNLPKEQFPAGVPHAERVHSGFFIVNHRTGQVEDVIEGGFFKENLIIYRNKQETINKLQNTGLLFNDKLQKKINGNWRLAYDIRLELVSDDVVAAVEQFNKFESEFNAESSIKPIPFIAGYLDSQTCAHYLLKQIKPKDGAYPSPYQYVKNGKEYDCTLGWSQGGISPMELRRHMESELSEEKEYLSRHCAVSS